MEVLYCNWIYAIVFAIKESVVDFMGKKTPRRLQRFDRQGIEPTDEAMTGIDENKFSYSPKPEEKRTSGKEMSSKEIATSLAMEEVQKFKEQHKRLPEKKEYDSIAESIYAQLKDKARRKKAIERLERKKGKRPREKSSVEGTETGKKKRKHVRPGHEKKQVEEKEFEAPKEEIGLSSEQIKGMSVEDLFSTEKSEKESGELGELEKIGEDEFSLEGLESMEEKSGASNKCPKCGAETEAVVFCPECGTAFCEKCAKKVEVLGNVKTFVCPGCGKKIKK